VPIFTVSTLPETLAVPVSEVAVLPVSVAGSESVSETPLSVAVLVLVTTMVKVTALPVETFAVLLCIVTVKPAGAPDCGVVVGAGVNVKAGMGVVVGGVTGVLLTVTKLVTAGL